MVAIEGFKPIRGYPGTMLEIFGEGFSPEREENKVVVGGAPALVVEADKERLQVITSASAKSGAVEVHIGGHRDDWVRRTGVRARSHPYVAAGIDTGGAHGALDIPEGRGPRRAVLRASGVPYVNVPYCRPPRPRECRCNHEQEAKEEEERRL